ncbi:tetratricopeptide repeat protein [Horticoccus sp. 23ND18S-11]|uniref:tetratricopeptide repeat protein n=1 Tax=Horticoccus sp. 23ND18S-11 TaxID=3391832 RepID=UPI0039C9DE23
MPEVSVASLDPRHQKLVENARVALDRGNFDYVLEVTSQVLKMQPGCLPVRKLQRVAQLRQNRGKSGGFMGKAIGWSTAPFLFAGSKKDPQKQLETAEGMLAKDPTSVGALRMLAEAAGALGFPETVAFALDAVRELEPDNRANLLALGEAWLAAGKATEALKIADELLKDKPTDADAQNLMRKSSVAQTVTKQGWDQKTSYREKLRDEAQAVSLEQSAKMVTGDVMSQRLLEEGLARVAKEPNNLNHYRSVSQAYRQMGNLDEALVWVRKAREQPVGKTDAALEKQESELATAVVEKHMKDAETAVAAAPGDAAAQAKLDAARKEFADFKLSESKRYVERYPNDYPARYALGALLLEQGQTDAAIAQFQQAQKGPQVRVSSLVGLGRCFKAKRLYDLAVSQLTTAKNDLATMDDIKKDVIYELGACYELMGKPELAIEEFKVIYSEDIGFRDVADKINAFYSKS